MALRFTRAPEPMTVDPSMVNYIDPEKTRRRFRPDNPDFLPQLGEQPAQAPEPWKPGLALRVGSALQGISKADLIKEHEAEVIAAQNRAMQQQLMAKVLTDPREKLAFLADPKKWAEKVASNYEAATLAEGSTRRRPGYEDFTAPTTEISGDSVVKYDPSGMEILGKRDPSFTEENRAENAALKMLLDERRLKGQLNRWGAMNEQGEARVGLSRAAGARAAAKAGARPAAGGRAAPARRVLGSTLPEGY
ncbi:hypothetical protein [Phenylobacterium sp.]|uniref:hypothetical protein n=1 Tax=Phenylobacterium sp. TaxID=1871053 RepID=UPI002FC67441